MIKVKFLSRCRIHERTISFRFLGIILRVLRLEVSIYNVYITNQFQTLLFKATVNSKEENFFFKILSRLPVQPRRSSHDWSWSPLTNSPRSAKCQLYNKKTGMTFPQVYIFCSATSLCCKVAPCFCMHLPSPWVCLQTIRRWTATSVHKEERQKKCWAHTDDTGGIATRNVS